MAEAIGPLVGRLHQLAVHEARTLVAVNKDMRRLRDKLMWLQAFLREADNKRRAVSDELTRVWLQQTRDAVFDAEDAVDHYYLQVHPLRYHSWRRAIHGFIATFTTQAVVRHNLSSKINDINTRLEDIIQNKGRYKIDETAATTAETWRASTSISDGHKKLDDFHQPPMVKRLNKRSELEEKLRNRDPFVVYVVGESSVGKTTLVRDVYKRMKAQRYFDVQAMESIAPHLSAVNIRQQIVQQLTDDDKNCPKGMVDEMLERALQGKKFLLVIDGEISSTAWKDILHVLSKLGEPGRGSKVVRIAQQEPEKLPGSDIDHHETIKVDLLDEDSTRELFLKRLVKKEAAIGEEAEHNRFVEEHSRKIFDMTKGLPLAVVLLSGLVQTKECPDEWNKVFDYLWKQSKRLHSILSLCFEDLPHELKSCFLYFAALPANVMIEARTLVCMWMAEGFLRPKEGKTMEKVGYRYLNELVIRNLVNLVHMDESSPGSRFLVVQNKVYDFLRFEAHEASFVEVHSGDDIPSLTSARRLSLQNYTDKFAALASPLPKLRSIFSHFELLEEYKEDGQHLEQDEDPWQEEDPTPNYDLCLAVCGCKRHGEKQPKKDKHINSYIRKLLLGSEFLRVINLQGIEIGDKLPDEIGNAVHLHYLGVTSCSLEHIPPSVGRLTSLETLDVRETYVRELPKAFWMIKTLRHVFGFVLMLPKEVGDLKLLHTLDSIRPDSQKGWDSRTLAKMIHLQSLVVWGLSASTAEALRAALSKLEHLTVLALHCKGKTDTDQADEADRYIPSSVFTSSFLRHVKTMELDGELRLSSSQSQGSQPGDIRLILPNLITLSLKGSKVPQVFINKLAELPILATLALYSGSYSDEQLIFSRSGFQCLKKLRIDVEELKRIKIDEHALPRIQELDIHSHYSESDHRRVQMDVSDERIRKIVDFQDRKID